MIAFVTAFHSDIIDITFYDLMYMLMEDRIHGVLISYTSILQAKEYLSVSSMDPSPTGLILQI